MFQTAFPLEIEKDVKERLWIRRFDDVPVKPGGRGSFMRIVGPQGRHGDQQEFAPLVPRPQRSRQFATVHLGHGHIQDARFRVESIDFAQCGFPAMLGPDRKSDHPEEYCQRFGSILVVIDNEHPQRREVQGRKDNTPAFGEGWCFRVGGVFVTHVEARQDTALSYFC